MVNITEEEISHLAKLCRIGCPQGKQKAMAQDFAQIVHYIEGLSAIDTTGVLPCVSVCKETISTPLREDTVQDMLDKELFLQGTFENIAGLVRVPTVIHSKENS